MDGGRRLGWDGGPGGGAFREDDTLGSGWEAVPLIDPPMTFPGAVSVYDIAAQFLRVPLSHVGVGARSGSSQDSLAL